MDGTLSLSELQKLYTLGWVNNPITIRQAKDKI